MTQRTAPLARQVRKLRRHYDQLARVAARCEGRPVPQPGLSFKLALAATMRRLHLSRREAVEHLLQKRSADLKEEQA